MNRKKTRRAEGLVNRKWSADRHCQKEERGRETKKKGGRKREGRIKEHFYYSVTNPLIALITPKGKQNSSAATKCINN